MDEYHAWADILHHFPYLFPIGLGVAMYFAFPAARFRVALRTMVKPLMCICQVIAAFIAQIIAIPVMMSVTIYGNHLSDYLLLSFYPFHTIISTMQNYNMSLSFTIENSQMCIPFLLIVKWQFNYSTDSITVIIKVIPLGC